MSDTDGYVGGVADIFAQKVSMALEPSLRGVVDQVVQSDAVLTETLEIFTTEPKLVDGADVIYRGAYYGEPEVLAPTITPVYTGQQAPPDIQAALAPWVRFIPAPSRVGWDYAHTPKRAILAPVGTSLVPGSANYPWALRLLQYRSEANYVWSVDAPQPDPEFFFQVQGDERNEPALTFNGRNGFAKMDRYSGPASFDDLTLAVVVVPHLQTAAYPIYDWDGSGSSYCQLRYAHGRISLMKDQREIAAAINYAKPWEPVAILLSFDGSNDTGTFMVCDSSRRVAKQFSMPGLNFSSVSGQFGAARTRANWPRGIFGQFAHMELLDIVWWNTAMTSAQLEAKLGLLTQAWGIRT